MSSHPLSVRKPIPWGFLVWTLPLLYVFWAPYQQRAGWLEWTATALTLAAVLALFLAALAYDEHRRIVAGICVAVLLIAIGFLAYRPSGGIYFPVAAAFVAPAVGGRVGLTMTILSAVAVLFGVEWSLLYFEIRKARSFLCSSRCGSSFPASARFSPFDKRASIAAPRQSQRARAHRQGSTRRRGPLVVEPRAQGGTCSPRLSHRSAARPARDQRRRAHRKTGARGNARGDPRLPLRRHLRGAGPSGVAAESRRRQRGTPLRAARNAAGQRARARADRTRSRHEHPAAFTGEERAALPCSEPKAPIDWRSRTTAAAERTRKA